MLAAAGAGPWPATTMTWSRSALYSTIGTSPPGPLRCGSTTWRTKPAAAAASKALPPRSSTAMPAAEASQWVEDTMPKVPLSSGLVPDDGITVLRVRTVCTVYSLRLQESIAGRSFAALAGISGRRR